jgi:predicted DsbA family dithiol-disulfide isomerase
MDELRPEPLFCGFEAGCARVTTSSLGRVLGIPLPVYGVVAFGAYFALTLFPRQGGMLLGILAVVAGAIGMALVLAQVLYLKSICRLCLAIDVCGMLLAIVYLQGGTINAGDRPAPPRRWAWCLLAVVAVSAPWLWSWLRPSPPTPEQVKAHWEPGKLNVVVVTDFECEACRQTHRALKPILDQRDDVHLVLLVHPLPQHPNARTAARAYWFALSQNKGPQMAEALFEAEDLSASTCEQLVKEIGLDLSAYHKFIDDPSLDERIDESSAWVKGTGASGLPVIWIQEQRLVGVQNGDAIRVAIQRALR